MLTVLTIDSACGVVVYVEKVAEFGYMYQSNMSSIWVQEVGARSVVVAYSPPTVYAIYKKCLPVNKSEFIVKRLHVIVALLLIFVLLLNNF